MLPGYVQGRCTLRIVLPGYVQEERPLRIDLTGLTGRGTSAHRPHRVNREEYSAHRPHRVNREEETSAQTATHPCYPVNDDAQTATRPCYTRVNDDAQTAMPACHLLNSLTLLGDLACCLFLPSPRLCTALLTVVHPITSLMFVG